MSDSNIVDITAKLKEAASPPTSQKLADIYAAAEALVTLFEKYEMEQGVFGFECEGARGGTFVVDVQHVAASIDEVAEEIQEMADEDNEDEDDETET